MCRNYWGLHEYETVVFWSREGIPLSLSVMGVPGSQGARPGGLVGSPEQYTGNLGGSPPDRVDQRRLRIVPRKCVGMLIISRGGGGKHVIYPGGSRVITYIVQNPGATPRIVEVVMASLYAMQTMQNKMAVQVTQLTQLIAGLSGSFEGDRSSQGPSTREVRGEQKFIG